MALACCVKRRYYGIAEGDTLSMHVFFVFFIVR